MNTPTPRRRLLNSASLSFYVAAAKIYSSTSLTTLQSYFGVGATAYVTVAGVAPGSGWQLTWLLPNGSTAAAFTGNGGPNTSANGVLPQNTGTYLQYPLINGNGAGSAWNQVKKYSTKPAKGNNTFNSGDQGAWSLTLQLDSQNFITLPVFTVDTTPPAAPTVTSPPGPVTTNSSTTYTIAGTATDNAQLAKVQVFSGTTVVASQTVSGASANFSIAVPLVANQANNFTVVVTDAAGNVSASTTVPTIVDDSIAPTSSANALSPFTNNAGITIAYTASDNSGGSGLQEVDLYVKGPTDASYNKVLTDFNISGSFSYSAGEGDGTYSFYTVAIDKAGNVESAPINPDASTLLDTVKPASSANALSAYANSTTITVGYTASDSSPSSGLKKVELYVEGPTDSAYKLAGTDNSPAASGNSISYTANEGDGTYRFYTLAYDNAGNVQVAPAVPNTSTLLDTVKPASSANALPAFTNSTSITVGYIASDASPGSGLAKVELYVKGPSDSAYKLAGTDSSPAGSGHSISYTANEGDGTYSFYTTAYDNAGNVEVAHSAADTSTLLDTINPASSANSLPAIGNSTSMMIGYTASDASPSSGLAKVELYVKGPADSAYKLAGTDGSPAASGHSISYTANEGDGIYAFYTLAYDNAGNVQAVPGSPNTSTQLDTVRPSSSANPLPAYTNSASITVGYTASAPGISLTKVELYVAGPADGGIYKLAGTDNSPAASGHSISYTANEGDGTYSFYTLAYDSAGNVQLAPSTPNTSILVDTLKPTSSASASPYTNSTSMTVGYTASDASPSSGLTKVELYVSGPSDGGVYNLAGTDNSPAASGNTIGYTANEGDGAYSFKTLAYDNAGNIETTHSSADTSILLDTVKPTSQASVSNYDAACSTFTIAYVASDNSGGSGLQEVDLYSQGPADAGFAKVASTTTSLASGSFSYQANGSGSYSFYTVAIDRAGNVQSNDGAPQLATGGNIALNVGDGWSRSNVSFSDPGSGFTGTVDYGDGSGVQSLTLSGNSFNLSHSWGSTGTYTVLVTVKDSDGGVGTSIFTAAISDAPTFTEGADLTVSENAGPQTVVGWATGISSGQGLAFQVTGNTNPSLFSAGPDIAANGTLTFTPANDANGMAAITVVLQDSGGVSAPQRFLITVNPVNQPPTFTAGPDETVLEGSGPQTFAGWATAISPGPANEWWQTMTFQITNNSNAALFSAGPAISADGILTFTPAAGASGSATITVVLHDNGGTANGGVDTSDPQTFNITVAPVNAAPVLTDPADPALPPIPRNSTNPPGELISTLLGTTVTDPDGPSQGIAVIAVGDPTQGTWQYLPAGSTTWQAAGSVSSTAALLLLPTDMLRFTPVRGFVGDVALTFRAWDQSGGAAHTYVNASLVGGSTAFSTAVGTMTEQVAMTLKPALEDSKRPPATKVWNFLSPQFIAQNPLTTKGIAVVGLTTGSGTWQFSVNAGLSWHNMPAVSESSALLLRAKDLVRFVPAHDFKGTVTITYHGWTASGGIAGTTTGVVPGNPRFSAATDFSMLVVVPAIDRAVLQHASLVLTPVSNTNINPAGDLVSSFASALISDVDGPAKGIGIAITGQTGGTHGVWQYSLDGGLTWHNLGAVSATSARLLRGTDRIRFLPNAGFVGEPTFSFRAWDQSLGVAGGLFNTATHAFSLVTDTAQVVIS